MRGGPRSAREGGVDSILLWRGQAVMGVMGQLSCGACGTEGLRRALTAPKVSGFCAPDSVSVVTDA